MEDLKNKNIIISYQKEYGKNGTIYNQTIKISKEIQENFNKYLKEIKNNINFKKQWSNEDLKISCYTECLQEGKNFLTLTMLDLFMKFYLKTLYTPPRKDSTYERIKWRNTIIKVQ